MSNDTDNGEDAELKDRQNALSERFAKHRDADPTDTTDTSDASDADDTGEAGNAGGSWGRCVIGHRQRCTYQKICASACRYLREIGCAQ